MHKDLLNKDYVVWREFLNKSDSWNREEIKKYEEENIKRILKHAVDNSIGYNELYKNFDINDFNSLPTIDKKQIQNNLQKFSCEKFIYDYITTGGSTGVPFGFYRDEKSFAKELASKAHQYSRIGWKEGDKQVVLRGLPINNDEKMEFFPEYNELRCSSYYMTTEHFERYYKKILEYKPEWIKCYPSSGFIFANWLKENNKKISGLKGILCASENLYDFQKDLLTEVFQCRVFSHYGHYELAALSGFCEYEDTYHVLPQYGFVQLLDSNNNIINKEGQIGEITATSFIMSATPFIKYKTGDFAVYKGFGCKKCNRPYHLWEKIEGRLQEFIITKQNRLISMTSINFHDDIFDQLLQFQFVQEKMGVVEFRYIPKIKLTKEIEEKIKVRILNKMGNDVELTVKQTKEIELTKRGKHRFLIQKLDIKYNDK